MLIKYTCIIAYNNIQIKIYVIGWICEFLLRVAGCPGRCRPSVILMIQIMSGISQAILHSKRIMTLAGTPFTAISLINENI